MITKTDSGLVEWCHVRLGDGYVYATYFSRIITEAIIQAKALQYPKVYTPEYIKLSRRWIGDDAGDCVGLIKGYYWQDPATGKVIYKLDGRPDVSANGMYTAGRTAGGKSSDQNFNKTWGYIRTIPEHPGVLVWFSGHIGVYVGNGEVIESRGVRYGVVKTKLADRPWTNWVFCPYITYGGDSMTLQKGVKGQAVYNYQIICKRLGKNIGQYDDMVLKDSAGKPLKTGCDGSFGKVMVDVTNELNRAYGLPESTTGLVSDTLMGKLNQAIQKMQTGVPQAEYDKVVTENTNIKYENSQLVQKNKSLTKAAADLSIENALLKLSDKAYQELQKALETIKKHIP